jgi:hypothetical protein
MGWYVSKGQAFSLNIRSQPAAFSASRRWHRVSVEWLTPRTLLVALDRHDLHAPAQHRSQLGVAEFVNGAVIVDRRVDDLHGLALQAVGDLLERPALLVHERTFDELLGQLVDLLALLLDMA